MDKSVFIIFDWGEVPTDKVALNNAARGFICISHASASDALALSPAQYKIGNNGAGLRLFLCTVCYARNTMEIALTADCKHVISVCVRVSAILKVHR